MECKGKGLSKRQARLAWSKAGSWQSQGCFGGAKYQVGGLCRAAKALEMPGKKEITSHRRKREAREHFCATNAARG